MLSTSAAHILRRICNGHYRMHSTGATLGKGLGEVTEFGYGVVRTEGWMQLSAEF